MSDNPNYVRINPPYLDNWTVRDQFAMAALHGYRAHPAHDRKDSLPFVAEYCYWVADAMLAARSK